MTYSSGIITPLYCIPSALVVSTLLLEFFTQSGRVTNYVVLAFWKMSAKYYNSKCYLQSGLMLVTVYEPTIYHVLEEATVCLVQIAR